MNESGGVDRSGAVIVYLFVCMLFNIALFGPWVWFWLVEKLG